MATEYVEVACDESGNEGENLSRAGSRVFAHAGVNISSAAAEAVMDEVRARTGAKAGELKSSVLLKPTNRDVLEWFLEEPQFAGNVNIHFTDKQYFACGKIIDMLVEPVLHERGHDLYRNGKARQMAHTLFVDAPAQLGSPWDTGVDEFNTMLRAAVRSGSKATLEEFYSTLETLRGNATGKLALILRLVHAGRSEAANLIADTKTTSVEYLALDPTFAALATVARTWQERSGLPVRIVHDETSLLTAERIQTIKRGLAEPSVAGFSVSPVTLQSVTMVDSKSDSRIQVADLFAGVGRVIAIDALAGGTDQLIDQIQPFVDPNSIWGDDASWESLAGRAA
ncbi:DUF3800 domain-containing protein [Agromyces binzhouensis]|uniref:DUF3800 domain-containing protein n=1 Tax=Agromyces binzhouensis TaxID=1817495 RepID=UPI00362C8895